MTATDLKTGAETYSSGIAAADNYTRWVLSEFQGFFGRSILEVGFGHGGYRRFLPRGSRYTGIDMDAGSVERAKAMHPEDSFHVVDVLEPDLGELIREREVDTVLCVNVLEHIEDDRKAVRNMLEQLPEGGRLLLFVPAFQALYTTMDRLAGHLRRYRRPMLLGLIPGNGRVLRARYFNSLGGVGWWLNGLLDHQSLDDDKVNRQIAVFDRVVVPLARRVDLVTRGFFGQSLTCVAERR